MKTTKLTCLVVMFALLTLTACAPPVVWRTSPFDNSRSLEMVSSANLFDEKADQIGTMSLLWDGTMKKGTSYAKIVIKGEHQIANDTVLNINPGDQIINVKLEDVKNSSKITNGLIRETNLATGETKSYTNTVTDDCTILYFQIPDSVIQKVSVSKGVMFMVNFAHNEKVTLRPSGALRPWFAEFYNMKYSKP